MTYQKKKFQNQRVGRNSILASLDPYFAVWGVNVTKMDQKKELMKHNIDSTLPTVVKAATCYLQHDIKICIKSVWL